ncbi:hypothetical protein Tco_0730665 [Tanacetum coccineum]|uniref:Uncharacterized protein n=1 Tax=Tanacetum coccineum TaxID=301880 RepID=A0ABQ4YSF5_9ASTR
MATDGTEAWHRKCYTTFDIDIVDMWPTIHTLYNPQIPQPLRMNMIFVDGYSENASDLQILARNNDTILLVIGLDKLEITASPPPAEHVHVPVINDPSPKPTEIVPQPHDTNKILAGVQGRQDNNYFRAEGQNTCNFLKERPSDKHR